MNNWRSLEKNLLKSKSSEQVDIGFYDLIYTIANYEIFLGKNLIFTSQKMVERFLCDIGENKLDLNEVLTPVMLGELLSQFKSSKKPEVILVNPTLKNKNELLFEEVLFSPIEDPTTKKLMLTDPYEAMALLAISPDDQKRFGLEMVFYMITNKGLPDGESRVTDLKEKIDELAFMAPRVPIKKGAGSFFVIIINLENALEEIAFIRDYALLDNHANCIFVTSDFKMRSGKLEEIDYDGDKIDSIFQPMIKWQKSIQTLPQF